MMTASIQKKIVFQLKFSLSSNIAGKRRMRSYPKDLGAQNSEAARLSAMSRAGGRLLNFHITRMPIRIVSAVMGIFAVPT